VVVLKIARDTCGTFIVLPRVSVTAVFHLSFQVPLCGEFELKLANEIVRKLINYNNNQLTNYPASELGSYSNNYLDQKAI
jgi:hypothetical protein